MEVQTLYADLSGKYVAEPQIENAVLDFIILCSHPTQIWELGGKKKKILIQPLLDTGVNMLNLLQLMCTSTLSNLPSWKLFIQTFSHTLLEMRKLSFLSEQHIAIHSPHSCMIPENFSVMLSYMVPAVLFLTKSYMVPACCF